MPPRDRTPAPPPPLAPISAAELAGKTFPEMRWVVPGLIPEGAVLLVGAPKVGKSWLALQVALAAAGGGVALGHIPVGEPVDVLYGGLEDNQRRLQQRIAALTGGGEAPARLWLITGDQLRRAHEGGLEQLRGWLEQHPRALVVIDTLAKFRKPAPGQNVYAEDSATGHDLARLAADFPGSTVIAVHHVRKGKAEGDPFEQISGSNGLLGSFDAALILDRVRGTDRATLRLTGRDAPDRDNIGVRFTPECAWTLEGDARDHAANPNHQRVLDLLRAAPKPLKPAEVAAELGVEPNAARVWLNRLLQSGRVLKVSTAGVEGYVLATSGGESVMPVMGVMPVMAVMAVTVQHPPQPVGTPAPALQGPREAVMPDPARVRREDDPGITGITGITDSSHHDVRTTPDASGASPAISTPDGALLAPEFAPDPEKGEWELLRPLPERAGS